MVLYIRSIKRVSDRGILRGLLAFSAITIYLRLE